VSKVSTIEGAVAEELPSEIQARQVGARCEQPVVRVLLNQLQAKLPVCRSAFGRPFEQGNGDSHEGATNDCSAKIGLAVRWSVRWPPQDQAKEDKAAEDDQHCTSLTRTIAQGSHRPHSSWTRGEHSWPD
jgi:hypothetical protein